MNFNRINIKLGATIILFFLVLLFPLGFVMNQIFSGFYLNQANEETNQLSSQYADLISNNRSETTIQMLEVIAQFSQIPLIIVDAKGEIVAVSNVAGIAKGEIMRDAELGVLASRKQIEKTVENQGESFYVIGTPIMDESTFYGGVFVLSSIEGVNESLSKVRTLLILSGLGSFFVALGMTIVLSKTMSQPLVEMEVAARKIAKGNLDTRVKVIAKDEIGSLAVAINDLAKDLKRYQDTRKEFLANISHELRTPMAYLEGYAEILKKGLYESEKEQHQYLDIIQQETKRLTQLSNDLLELSKIEEGRISLEFEWIDLTEVMENVLLRTASEAEKSGLSFQVTYEEELPLFYGDGLRTEQIYFNLVENAIRYTDSGTILIQIRQVEDKIKTIIEDTGSGIPEKELSHIFERFYRMEKSRSRKSGGSGLGLPIVQQLVELQNGTIHVSSRQGEGTRFDILFPITENVEIKGERDG
ncbi:ATP-binding protein [Halalkalibacter oceani]|uniref:ATP-binding protein n=1 Tax=Halalkalibacter oceani TaxID=1653776 RepID=UPI0033919B7C